MPIKPSLLSALLVMSLTALADGGFSDIDIRQITQAVAAVRPKAAITSFEEASWVGCPNTSEDHCTREAVVVLQTTEGPRKLIVSNVSDGWIVGHKQLETAAEKHRKQQQSELNKRCERQWNVLTQPGQPLEHWDEDTRRKWWKEHCTLAPEPPPKPIGMDSSLGGQ